MASKQVREETDVDELLDTVDKTLDRLKTLYEQYFLGIQKQAPSFIHNDIERKLRDLAQMQLRNTGLRYRLATLQQKFGSYNSYWRRTLRQIENGSYARQLSKVGRDAVRSGAEIPEEILARMPKRMRDQVLRDREQALAIARRHHQVEETAGDGQEPPEADADFIAMIKEPTEVRRKLKSTDGAHVLSSDDDFDIDAFFAQVEQHDDKAAAPRTTTPPRGRGATRQPANRGRTTSAPPSYDDPDRPRPITRNDLKRAATEPATPIARERTGSSPVIKRSGDHAEPAAAVPGAPTAGSARAPGGHAGAPAGSAGSSAGGAAARPGGPPSVPGRAGPPPVPGRTTGAIPSLKRPDTNLESEEPTNPNVFPAGRTSGAHAALDPRTGRPVDRGQVDRGQVDRGPLDRGPADRGGVPSPIGAEPSSRAKTQTGSGMASQMSRPNPIAPGSAAARGPVPVESMAGPFPRNATPAQGVPALAKPTVPKPAVQTGVVPVIPQTGAIPRIPGSSATPSAGIPAIPRPGTGAQPAIPRPGTGAQPAIPRPATGPSTTATGPQPAIPRPATGPSATATGQQPAIPRPGVPAMPGPGTGPDMTGPHQAIARPPVTNETQALPTMVRPPSSSRTTPAVGVPTIAGEAQRGGVENADPAVIVTKTPGTGMPRDARTPHAGVPASARTPAAGVPIKPGTGARPPAAAPQKPPPGMTDADVNALYAKYVKAKEMVGEKIGPGEHNKLLKTINAQAPKIMEQYKAKGVDFSVVVKDNQVIIRAKPKT